MPLVLSDEWNAFEAILGIRPKFGGKDIPEIRENVAKARAGAPPIGPSSSLNIREEQLDGFRVRVYEPNGSTERTPVAVFTHGGGYCIGDLDSEEEIVRFMADSVPMTFVSVEYRLAPESPWPASLNDSVAAAKWVVQRYKDSEKVDISKLLITGGSAGAQLALATTLKLIEQGISVHGVVALAPISIGESAVPSHLKESYTSMEENADAPLVDRVVLRQFMEANGHDDKDPYFSVLLSPTLQRFPKTYIVTCGADVLRDDGFLLAEQLRSHG